MRPHFDYNDDRPSPLDLPNYLFTAAMTLVTVTVYGGGAIICGWWLFFGPP